MERASNRVSEREKGALPRNLCWYFQEYQEPRKRFGPRHGEKDHWKVPRRTSILLGVKGT
jgi:hypothetical protein